MKQSMTDENIDISDLENNATTIKIEIHSSNDKVNDDEDNTQE